MFDRSERGGGGAGRRKKEDKKWDGVKMGLSAGRLQANPYVIFRPGAAARRRGVYPQSRDYSGEEHLSGWCKAEPRALRYYANIVALRWGQMFRSCPAVSNRREEKK